MIYHVKAYTKRGRLVGRVFESPTLANDYAYWLTLDVEIDPETVEILCFTSK